MVLQFLKTHLKTNFYSFIYYLFHDSALFQLFIEPKNSAVSENYRSLNQREINYHKKKKQPKNLLLLIAPSGLQQLENLAMNDISKEMLSASDRGLIETSKYTPDWKYQP